MRIEGKEYRTIWFENNIVKIIDQTKLPHQFVIKDLKTIDDAINAIKVMEVRGAPLIGATAAYGLVLAILENNDQRHPFLRDLEHNGHGFRERLRPGLFPGAKARVPGGPLQIPARAQVGSGLH